jgi:flagellar basal-body rod protein FlgF
VIAGVDTLVAGMQALWQRHEVLANNLANVTTTAFKRDDVMSAPDGVTVQPGLFGPNLVYTGQGLLHYTDHSQGPLQHTGRALDLALDGSGFFVVDTPAGQRYTRSGTFTLAADGTLVTGDGAPVLGVAGRITLPSSDFTVSGRGEIRAGGGVVATLRIVDFPKPYQLLKEGSNLYVLADPTILPIAATGEVVSGALEGSNVNPVEAMVSMIEILRRYEAAQKALQALEEANQAASTQIGTVI